MVGKMIIIGLQRGEGVNFGPNSHDVIYEWPIIDLPTILKAKNVIIVIVSGQLFEPRAFKLWLPRNEMVIITSLDHFI